LVLERRIQPKLIPQNHRQPACAPLTRATQPLAVQPDTHHVAVERGRDAIQKGTTRSDAIAPTAKASTARIYADRWLSLISPRE
jgi:hypothetical protein